MSRYLFLELPTGRRTKYGDTRLSFGARTKLTPIFTAFTNIWSIWPMHPHSGALAEAY